MIIQPKLLYIIVKIESFRENLAKTLEDICENCDFWMNSSQSTQDNCKTWDVQIKPDQNFALLPATVSTSSSSTADRGGCPGEIKNLLT